MTLCKSIYKPALSFLILFISVFAIAKPAMADATTGELFGYKIGGKYSITKKTNKRSDGGGTLFLIRAENPVKSENIGKVYLITSTITYTVVSIYSNKRFRTKTAAVDFSNRYVAFLSAKYREYNPQYKGSDDSTKLFINIKNLYELRISVFSPKDEKSSVQIRLSLHDENKKEYLDLIDKEHDQLLIKNAKTKGIDKGL